MENEYTTAMQQQMLEYFKSYQIDVAQLLLSGNSYGSLELKDPKDDSTKKALLNYKINHDKNEAAFFFWCRNDIQYKELIHNFSNGLKNIVKACNAVIIEKPGHEKGWYGWSGLNQPVGYSIKNETLGFTMRILIPKVY